MEEKEYDYPSLKGNAHVFVGVRETPVENGFLGFVSGSHQDTYSLVIDGNFMSASKNPCRLDETDVERMGREYGEKIARAGFNKYVLHNGQRIRYSNHEIVTTRYFMPPEKIEAFERGIKNALLADR